MFNQEMTRKWFRGGEMKTSIQTRPQDSKILTSGGVKCQNIAIDRNGNLVAELAVKSMRFVTLYQSKQATSAA